MSNFQRAIGVRLYSPKVYRRSFARMGEWKGFFMTHSERAPKKKLMPLLRGVRKDLGQPNARMKLVAGARQLLAGTTGHAVVWAKHLRLLRTFTHTRLVARLYVRVRPLGDA